MNDKSIYKKNKDSQKQIYEHLKEDPDLKTSALKPTYKMKALVFLGKYWVWVFLIILIGGFSSAPGFLGLGNFQGVLANNSLLLVLALGQSFVIISGGIDLSTGWVMGLASVVASLVMRRYPLDANLFLVISSGFLACAIIGLAAGFINGTVISRLKVPPFIATLGMYGIARGFGYVLSGGPPVSVNQPGIGQFGNGFVLYFHPTAGYSFFKIPFGVLGEELRKLVPVLPYLIIYFIIILIITNWVLSKTRFGQHVYAVGGNSMAALRAGIPVKIILTKVYMLSGLMAGLSGFLYVMRYSGGVAAAGDALNLNSVAAVVVGGASLLGGEGTLIGTLVGTLIISIISNGLIILGIDPFYQYVVVGMIIIFAVLVDQLKK